MPPKKDKKLEKKLSSSKGKSDNTEEKKGSPDDGKQSQVSDGDEEGDDCIDCGAEIVDGDRALQCDFCDHWFCFECTEVNAKTYNALESSKNNGVLWMCKHCRISMPGYQKLAKRTAVLENNAGNVDKWQKEFDARLKALEKKAPVNDPSSSKKTDQVIQSMPSVSDMVSQVMVEQREREARKLNVMCFGLAESEKELQEERRNDDKDRIKEVIGNVMNLSSTISDTIRLGRYEAGNQRARPIKFSVDSMEEKQKILDRARVNVKNSTLEVCRHLYFHSDLTNQQREDAFKMKVERRRRNAERQQAEGQGAQGQQIGNARMGAGGDSGTSGQAFH